MNTNKKRCVTKSLIARFDVAKTGYGNRRAAVQNLARLRRLDPRQKPLGLLSATFGHNSDMDFAGLLAHLQGVRIGQDIVWEMVLNLVNFCKKFWISSYIRV